MTAASQSILILFVAAKNILPEKHKVWLKSGDSFLVFPFSQVMLKGNVMTTPPSRQQMEGRGSLQEEHNEALERALSLHLPHPASQHSLPFQDQAASTCEHYDNMSSCSDDSASSRTMNWDELVEKLFDGNEPPGMVSDEDDSLGSSVKLSLPVR